MDWYRSIVTVIASLAITTFCHAEEIRLVGPDGQLHAIPTYIVPETLDGQVINRVENKILSQRTYGPTAIDETLWSIGQTVRKSEDQSVYKMVLAIYRANPTAFEDRNIHLLKAGSTIQIPTDAEVEKQNVSEAVRLFRIHELKPSYLAKMARENGPTQIQVEDSRAREIQDKQVEFLQQQLQISQQEFSLIQKNNQDLLNALGTIRTDVVELKGQLELEAERRLSVEKLILQQSPPQQLPLQDSLLTNVWVIVALSAVITALIVLLIVRLSWSVRPMPGLDAPPSEPKALNPAPAANNDLHPEIENVEPESLDNESLKPKPQIQEATTVSGLDKAFEQELDKILNQGQTEDQDSSVTLRVDELPEYGEDEALADAKKEAAELLRDEQAQEQQRQQSDVASVSDTKNKSKAEITSEHKPFRTIDEIMTEADTQPADNPDDEELNLKVGLDEFPDVIGKVELTDVDKSGELASQLDLASVYIQMSDLNHAKKLLKVVLAKGDKQLQTQAQQLLDSIGG